MNKTKFWNMLNKESKKQVNEMFKNYAVSEGAKGRIFELYEEGASAIGLSTEEYLNEIKPNDYVSAVYESYEYRK